MAKWISTQYNKQTYMIILRLFIYNYYSISFQSVKYSLIKYFFVHTHVLKYLQEFLTSGRLLERFYSRFFFIYTYNKIPQTVLYLWIKEHELIKRDFYLTFLWGLGQHLSENTCKIWHTCARRLLAHSLIWRKFIKIINLFIFNHLNDSVYWLPDTHTKNYFPS